MPRRLQRRAGYTRAGDRTIRVNSPDGFPNSARRIQVPISGFENPGFIWTGGNGVVSSSPAEKMAAVMRATGLIAGTIAAMPWRVQRGTERLLVPPWIEDPQLARPDMRLTSESLTGWETRLDAVSFREQAVYDLLIHGNAFIYVPLRGADGAPLPPVFLLDPTLVDSWDGGYYVAGERLPDKSIIHLRGAPPYDTETGMGTGVLAAYAQSLGLLDTSITKARNSATAAVPSGVVEIGSGYSPTVEETRELREQWQEIHGGTESSIAVLNAAMTFRPISFDNKSLQLIEMADFGLKQVALAFGLDPSWLGVPSSSLTYNTTVLRGLELRTFSLLTWVRRIESVIDAELPRGTELSIVMDGLERADTESRYRAYDTAIRTGVMTRDEARELEGLPPLGEGGTT